ncbi:hypothetical protein BD410DRAFT_784183 [Rickenella mellea]|uniref:Pali-domain-containing protein n=1 Tax=Rickenella mellea TaxID=50990 RepID=A0A4Y7QGZ8_9AGAM|nr:hypothetical protein BD410DRAFT_784183 [Rickenella mellea]
MRRTSYFLIFLAVLATTVLNAVSITRPDWLFVHSPDIFHSRVTVTYGLRQRCEASTINIPTPGSGGGIHYDEFSCRPFPTRMADQCDDENRTFCELWWTAGYAAFLSVAFGGVATFSVLLGSMTRSTRRTMWKSVAGFITLQACLQIVTFAIVTDIYRNVRYQPFDYARPSVGYVLNTVSWVANVLLALVVVVTGLAAEAGHSWAAGNRSYRPLQG